jgi:SOS-response transcriptional repressor LexA
VSYDSERALSDAQRLVLTSITTLTEQNGHAPTVRELATHLGKAMSTTQHTLNLLRSRRAVEWTPGKARTLVVVPGMQA